jgi:hypothetical protein
MASITPQYHCCYFCGVRQRGVVYLRRTNTKVFFLREAGLQLARLSFIYLTSRIQSAVLPQGRGVADLEVSEQKMYVKNPNRLLRETKWHL